MEPYMVQREEETVIGLAGSFGEEAFAEISKLWVKFKQRCGEIKNSKPGYALVVCLSTHKDVVIAPSDTFVYMAALPVTSKGDIPQGMVAYTIPASRYAVFTHKGALSNLPHTIAYIWGTWVPRNSQLHKKDAPDFELYDERFDPETLDGEFDIYVPVN